MVRHGTWLLIGLALTTSVAIATFQTQDDPAPLHLAHNAPTVEDPDFRLTPIDPEQEETTATAGEQRSFHYHCAFPPDAESTGANTTRTGPPSSESTGTSSTHVSPDTGNVTFTTTFDAPGTHLLTVQCEADEERSNPHTWTVHVRDDDA